MKFDCYSGTQQYTYCSPWISLQTAPTTPMDLTALRHVTVWTATVTVPLDVCVRRDGAEETAASVGPHVVLLDVELYDWCWAT